MNDRDFLYWLNGFFELSEENKGLTVKQVEIIKQHLSLVFTQCQIIDDNETKNISSNIVVEDNPTTEDIIKNQGVFPFHSHPISTKRFC